MNVINFNLTDNGYLAAPGGYPITLARGRETIATGYVPKGSASVTATVRAEAGHKPTVRAALLTAPTGSGSEGSDPGAAVVDGELTSLTSTATTLAITVPSGDGVASLVYCYRLWIEDMAGARGVIVDSVVVA